MKNLDLQIKEEIKIPNRLKDIYWEMKISPIDLLKNYALNLIYDKIHKYEAEVLYFKKKYSCALSEFKNKLNRMKEKENFEWEDDLMDWEFASFNLIYWQKKIKQVERK